MLFPIKPYCFPLRFGINGRACLLKTICEVAESRGLPYNGLLGKAFETVFLCVSALP